MDQSKSTNRMGKNAERLESERKEREREAIAEMSGEPPAEERKEEEPPKQA